VSAAAEGTRETPGADVVPLSAEHCDALLAFFRALPEGDRTFIKEDVTDPATVRRWTSGEAPGHRWVVPADGGSTSGQVAGYVAVVPLPGWSDHVGEIRLVVSPDRRGTGLGRTLARHALVQAVEAGLSKVVVEVVADQSSVAALFTGLGFTGEAVLVDQIRDREGQLHDLLVLAHHVGGTWSAMDTIGVADELGDAG
jgi:ribosomal protein S18 acetylase RimI-like enzyme